MSDGHIDKYNSYANLRLLGVLQDSFVSAVGTMLANYFLI